jgi:hypothetical protein
LPESNSGRHSTRASCNEERGRESIKPNAVPHIARSQVPKFRYAASGAFTILAGEPNRHLRFWRQTVM